MKSQEEVRVYATLVRLKTYCQT